MAATATDGIPDGKHDPQGSGNLLFGNLAADIAHAIFRLVLELDRIHDYNTPFEILSQLRKTIFSMRCVSALWNRFILSSPQYWCIVDVRAPQAAMVRTIERARAAPLCVYSTEPRHWKALHYDQILPLLVNRHGQIRTLRLDDRDLYGFGVSLLRPGLPNLRTLEVVPRLGSHQDRPAFAYDMPRLRHLKSTALGPESDLAWIQGLETLGLRKLNGFDPGLYHVLDLCSRSLKFLSLGLGSSWNGLPLTPAAISIPRLEALRLDIVDRRTAMEVTRRILVPRSAGGIIRVALEPRSLDAVQDLVDFLCPDDRNALDSVLATIEIDAEYGTLMAEYMRGNRAFQFMVNSIDQEADYEAIRNVLQALDLRLGHPAISVTISCNAPYDEKMLRLLPSSNVQRISILTYYPEDLTQFLNATISRKSAENVEQADFDEGCWAFQSVRYLAIDCNYRELVDLDEVVRIVATRQEQLRAKGGPSLEEMALAHCYFDDLVFAEAEAKLGVMGIVLREEQSREIVDFYLGGDIL
ncbi:hypothetical protein M407DRAFT_22172 [Tulasnella calospora MUT 4182]|uniref:F-box domain-containing protein n=1 Tax=Tulasnella calospora MUT 4182 TaxID=1051891 RepID=A0A0C3M507_9AGAM|nr:hypothetical protein M407DRAFT_22172 [Tulasnella calospora MUT 4182]